MDAVRVTPAASAVVLASSAAFCAASISVKTVFIGKMNIQMNEQTYERLSARFARLNETIRNLKQMNVENYLAVSSVFWPVLIQWAVH